MREDYTTKIVSYLSILLLSIVLAGYLVVMSDYSFADSYIRPFSPYQTQNNYIVVEDETDTVSNLLGDYSYEGASVSVQKQDQSIRIRYAESEIQTLQFVNGPSYWIVHKPDDAKTTLHALGLDQKRFIPFLIELEFTQNQEGTSRKLSAVRTSDRLIPFRSSHSQHFFVSSPYWLTEKKVDNAGFLGRSVDRIVIDRGEIRQILEREKLLGVYSSQSKNSMNESINGLRPNSDYAVVSTHLKQNKEHLDRYALQIDKMEVNRLVTVPYDSIVVPGCNLVLLENKDKTFTLLGFGIRKTGESIEAATTPAFGFIQITLDSKSVSKIRYNGLGGVDHAVEVSSGRLDSLYFLPGRPLNSSREVLTQVE